MNAQEHEQVNVRIVLTFVEAAQRDLERACAELSALDGWGVEYRRISKLCEQTGAEWRRIEFRRAARSASRFIEGAQRT